MFLSNPIDFFLCGSKTRYCTVDTEEVQSSHTHASTPQRKSRLLNIPNMHLIIAGCDVSGLTTYIAALQPPESEKDEQSWMQRNPTLISSEMFSFKVIILVNFHGSCMCICCLTAVVVADLS